MSIDYDDAFARSRDDLKITEWFNNIWTAWRTDGGKGDTMPRPSGWEQSILRFVAVGLPYPVIATAVDTAMQNTRIPKENTWRYFCGICWRRVDDLHEIAQSALAVQEGWEA